MSAFEQQTLLLFKIKNQRNTNSYLPVSTMQVYVNVIYHSLKFCNAMQIGIATELQTNTYTYTVISHYQQVSSRFPY